MKERKIGRAGKVALWSVLGLSGVVALGHPLLSRAKNAVVYRLMARSPMLDRVMLRADEALDLNLTERQKTEAKPIVIGAALKLHQLHQDKAMASEARRAAMKRALDDAHQQLASVLTTEQMAKIDAARAKFDLDLNNTQKSRLAAIMKGGFQQAKAIRGDASLSEEQKRLKLIALHTATRTDAAAVLTPAQQTKAAGRFDGEYLANILTRELNLTPEQKTQVRTIIAEAIKQSQAVFADTASTPEQKEAQFKAIHETGRAKIHEVLNSDQQTKFDNLRADAKANFQKLGGTLGTGLLD